MMILIWILLIIFGIKGRYYKNNKYIAYLQLIFCVLSMTFNTGADYELYEKTFVMVQNNPKIIFSGEWLLKALFWISGIVGNYRIAIFIIAVIGYSFLYKAIKFHTQNVTFILSFYLIAPFIIDTTQFKNFLAMSIWLYFSKYLFIIYKDKLEKKKNIIMYILGVFIASGVHTAFFVTLVFLFFVFVDVKFFLPFILTFVFLFTGLEAFNLGEKLLSYFSRFGNNFIYQTVKAKYLAYTLTFDNGVTKSRILVTILFLILFFGISLISYFVNNRKINILFKFMIYLNCIELLLIPFIYLSLEFYRFQRNILIIDFLGILSLSKIKKRQYRKIYLREIITIILVLILASYYMYIDTIMWNYKSVFYPLFNLI